MRYILHIADPGYSSWSMRAGLILARFDIPHDLVIHRIYENPPLPMQIGLPPARTVPVLVAPDGTVIRDTLAIAEELASRHPDLPLWSADPALRILARSLAAEMHASFTALRSRCPMCLRVAYDDVPVPDDLAADLDRLEVLWSDALDRSGGPWLAGEWSVADAFFAPVAARIAGYGLPVGPTAAAYATRHLQDDAFVAWRVSGLREGADLHETVYRQPYPRREWPKEIAAKR
ncbi:glutathione S-transferase [Palleronia sp.]|uniref:glutathione S-transferase n=1 Tax=Palleronia sp. TaxID=1940284 RepID=UPI0035C83AAD